MEKGYWALLLLDVGGAVSLARARKGVGKAVREGGGGEKKEEWGRAGGEAEVEGAARAGRREDRGIQRDMVVRTAMDGVCKGV